MLITNEGIIMRTPIGSISVIGRNTSGVKIMNIDTESGVYVASIAKTRAGDSDDSDETDGSEADEAETDGDTEAKTDEAGASEEADASENE